MDNDQISAALKGATLAFRGQRSDMDKPKTSLSVKSVSRTPNLPSASNNNGALRAATQASREYDATMSRSSSAQGISAQSTGGSYDDQPRPSPRRELEQSMVSQRLSQYLGYSPPITAAGSSHVMLTPVGKSTSDSKSASFIAATLAASRTGSPSPSAPGQGHIFTQTQLHPRMQRQPSLDNISAVSSSASLELTDTRPNPSTNSLISMFETRQGKREEVGPRNKSAEQAVCARAPAPAPAPARKTRLPTPERSPSPRLQQPAVSSKHSAITPEPQDMLEGTGNQRQPAPKPLSRLSPARQADNISAALQLGAAKAGVKPKPFVMTAAELSWKAKSNMVVEEATSSQIIRRHDTTLVSPRPQRMIKTPMTNFSAETPLLHAFQSTGALAGAVETATGKRPASSVSNSSDDTFVSASSNPSPQARSPSRGRPLSITYMQGRISRPSPTQRNSTSRVLDRSLSMRQQATPSPSRLNPRPSAPSTPPILALDSLTSAMLASNVASTRFSSVPVRNTSLPPPLPPPRRHNAHAHHLPNPLNALKSAHTGDSSSGKGIAAVPRQGTLLQTLRQPASRSDDEDARRHGHRHRKKALTKKHAHHEGSRRRWRDEVTTRERRRYEAVWASNKGLFLRPNFAFQHPDVWREPSILSPDLAGGATQVDLSRARDGDPRADLVVNVVVRDIWTRSRLPRDELSEVWELVAGRGGPNAASSRTDDRRAALAKDEFVVGMWLIDQRLRGRKIPARVTESVWESARGGTRVLEPKRKAKR